MKLKVHKRVRADAYSVWCLNYFPEDILYSEKWEETTCKRCLTYKAVLERQEKKNA